jgi:large subunit ribosomal protein L22
MGKKARARVLPANKAQAIGRSMRTSPRKLNLVAQSIRGKKADQALNELTFSPKRVARDVKKVLQSAIANAENNHDLDVDDLMVSEASVGKNMVLKRFHARARGRGARIEKPFSQVTIVVAQVREEEKAKKRGASKRPAAKERA